MKPGRILPFRATFGSARAADVRTRVGWLTPYEVEMLRSEARSVGSGAQLELFVPAGASEDGVTWVRSELEALRRSGIGVAVKRDAAWEFRDIEAGSGRRVRRT